MEKRKLNWILRLFLFALVVSALCASHYYAYNSGRIVGAESLAEENTLSASNIESAPTPTSSVTPIGGKYKPYGSLYNYMIANRVWITENGTHYHREGCFQLSGHNPEQCFLEYAKSRGYSPCSNCYD